MAEEGEGEVWKEIRDALRQLAEQGERQTALLEDVVVHEKKQTELLEGMEQEGRWRPIEATGHTVILGMVALFALFASLSSIYGFEIPWLKWWSLLRLILIGFVGMVVINALSFLRQIWRFWRWLRG